MLCDVMLCDVMYKYTCNELTMIHDYNSVKNCNEYNLK